MRIACPSCSAEYDVPDRLLASPARRLRCSRCATEFALPQAPADEVAEAAAPPPVAAEPPPPPTVPPETPVLSVAPELRPPPRAAEPSATGRALAWAWAASLAIVVGGVAALVVFRADVMAAWPPVTRLFAALGLA